MTEPPYTILLAEDDAPQRKILTGFLEKKGYRVVAAASADEAIAVSSRNEVDLLLTDLRLGGPDGVDLLETLRGSQPDLQAIVLTAYGTVEDAVRAMHAGAYDFLTKPVELLRLEILIEKAIEKSLLARENRGLRESVLSSEAFSSIVGESASIKQIIRMAAKAALSKASILILGESGTGKEVLARAVHLASPRKKRPFLTVNCAALPETLIESELFGHEKGAFTGAAAEKKGRFELAHQGTLFLDEVGEIPPFVQVKLLNVLQSGRFERVGGTRTIETDVRIVAATNRNLEAEVRAGTFREDLYYRLNVVTFTVPPLRDRREDIPLLARHFLEKQAALSGTAPLGISEEVENALKAYPFPGNIRELENWIERAVVFAEGEMLEREDLPERLSGAAQSESQVEGGLEAQVAALEISLIRSALERHDGNKSAAARELGITERNIRYKIKKFDL